MSAITRFALLAVVFVDLIGQGLVFPIINTLMMDQTVGFLPASTPLSTRQFNYGLIIGVFFLSWFLGAAYIAKLSDSIGRKKAIMICLFGALFGYGLTIVSLFADSLWLLIVGRAITGFTAGNQPIAQAAVIDMSKTAAERARNMGYIVAGISAGMVAGPIIGGVLSDNNLVGDIASVQLPFYCATVLVLITIVLVSLYFKDLRQPTQKLKFDPLEIFTLLWRIFQNPVVFRLSLVFFCFMFANNTFFIFMDNYLTSRFQIGLLGTSLAMVVLGVALATSSTFLVEPAQKAFSKITIIATAAIVMVVCALLFVAATTPVYCYILIAVFFFGFGIAYPTLLGIFSASVGENEQGWVMGITTAQFTLGAGIVSFVGGDLMSVDIRSPFFIVVAAALLALLMMSLTWRRTEIQRITGK